MVVLGRKREIEALDRDLRKEESQFVAVYGRRRVGKTYLIREHFHDQFFFYHTGLRGGSLRSQLIAFRASLIKYGQEKCPVLKNWLEAFEQLDRLVRAGAPGRKIIFIDELPWMDTPKSGLVTGLEYFWNAKVSARTEHDVFLIVCGSASSWIVKNLLKNTEGLYGRLTDRLQLRPFSLSECEEYASRLGLELTRMEIAEAYMVFGGIPYYWSLLRNDLSLAQNIDELLFAEGGKLRDEYNYLYASIFKNAEPHLKVVEALCGKKSGLTREEIIVATGLKNGGNFKTLLDELEQCDFIRSYTPVGKKNRGSVYQLIDSYTLFYHAFIRNRPKDDTGFWLSVLDSSRLANWRGLAFERLCLQHVREIVRALGISGLQVTAHSWRGADAQIDLLLDRSDRAVDICEIKCTDSPYEIDKSEYERLLNRKRALQATLPACRRARLVMITSAGLRHNKYWNAVQAELTLDDLFDVPRTARSRPRS